MIHFLYGLAWEEHVKLFCETTELTFMATL